jgi:hypothetical protein
MPDVIRLFPTLRAHGDSAQAIRCRRSAEAEQP